jgi:diaminohydroxyphosphoribosylaminopyrimidine deaminase/5-amino-6-(5-phosphoribosylamino)uracil reductase
VVTRADAEARRRAALERAGVEVLTLPAAAGAPVEIGAALAALAARGLTRVLVEGGGAVAASLLRARLVDRLVWFQGPLVIGSDGLAAIAELGLDALADCPRLRPLHGAALAPDGVQAYIVDWD